MRATVGNPIDITAIAWSGWPAQFTAGHVDECDAMHHLQAIEDLHPMRDFEGALLLEWPQWAAIDAERYAFRAADGRVAIATYDSDGERTVCTRLEVSRVN